jgi:hypothetical protein
MKYRRSFALALFMLCCLAAAGKDKKKVLLPDDVLQARTVLVVIDPGAGIAIDNPNANRKAQEDVEKALLKWGRFTIVMNLSEADLVIVVRTGSETMARPMIAGVPNNNRPVMIDPTESGGQIGGRSGNPAQPGDPTNAQPQRPTPQVEVGPAEDMFAVYRGKRENALDSSAVWRYMANDALRSPGVPAVEVFKKLIADAEKQKAATP